MLIGGDKFGGRPVNISRALRFQECLDICKMIDIGFSGARYTWSNNRPLSQLVQERIDRYFVNADWHALFPEVSVIHLERGDSNHCPVKLLLDRSHGRRLPRPFRFQPIWLSHSSFLDIVRDAWTNSSSLSHAISRFTDKAKVWNRDVFGNLFHRKKRVLARLRGAKLPSPLTPILFCVVLSRSCVQSLLRF